MKRLEITLTLYIDEIGSVTLGPVGFVYRGCKDATIFESTVIADEIVTTTDVVKPELNISTSARQEIILALSKLGFNQEESESWSQRLSPRRILDVAAWVRNKNGVGSPKKLAEKLFALG